MRKLACLVAALLAAQAPAPQDDRQFEDYKVNSRLRLPFRGEWKVVQGVRDDPVDEFHAPAAQGQRRSRFPVELTLERNGARYQGDGTKLEDYYAYGQEIIAPAGGVVLQAFDGSDDNPPGVLPQMPSPDELRKMAEQARAPGQPGGMQIRMPRANVVSIDHENGEMSVFLHIQKGSLQVKHGDSVRAGKVLARVGNSGMSKAPHLHYQLVRIPDEADDPAAHAAFVARIQMSNTAGGPSGGSPMIFQRGEGPPPGAAGGGPVIIGPGGGGRVETTPEGKQVVRTPDGRTIELPSGGMRMMPGPGQPLLPARFRDYFADGQLVRNGEPVKGQVLKPKD
jgi:murein DD-endopeptidase MepM/ murein hydrolase activator NlpD